MVVTHARRPAARDRSGSTELDAVACAGHRDAGRCLRSRKRRPRSLRVVGVNDSVWCVAASTSGRGFTGRDGFGFAAHAGEAGLRVGELEQAMSTGRVSTCGPSAVSTLRARAPCSSRRRADAAVSQEAAPSATIILLATTSPVMRAESERWTHSRATTSPSTVPSMRTTSPSMAALHWRSRRSGSRRWRRSALEAPEDAGGAIEGHLALDVRSGAITVICSLFSCSFISASLLRFDALVRETSSRPTSAGWFDAALPSGVAPTSRRDHPVPSEHRPDPRAPDKNLEAGRAAAQASAGRRYRARRPAWGLFLRRTLVHRAEALGLKLLVDAQSPLVRARGSVPVAVDDLGRGGRYSSRPSVSRKRPNEIRSSRKDRKSS